MDTCLRRYDAECNPHVKDRAQAPSHMLKVPCNGKPNPKRQHTADIPEGHTTTISFTIHCSVALRMRQEGAGDPSPERKTVLALIQQKLRPGSKVKPSRNIQAWIPAYAGTTQGAILT